MSGKISVSVRRALGAILMVLSPGAGGALAQTPAAPAVSVRDVVAGRALYDRRCAACHAGDLRGPQVPWLVGSDFQRRWAPRTSAQLADYILKMPPTNPDLTLVQAGELAALILAANGAPVAGCPSGTRAPRAQAVAHTRARDGGPVCAVGD